MSDAKESCFRTGYILGPRSDWFWFLGLPFIAVAVALGVREWLRLLRQSMFGKLLKAQGLGLGSSGNHVRPLFRVRSSVAFNFCVQFYTVFIACR